MKLHGSLQRWIAAGLLVTASLVAIAPVASADRGGRRYKGAGPVYSGYGYYGQQRVVYHQSSGAGPVLAGLIGGFLLGQAVSHPQPTVIVHEREYVPAPRYRYYDPYDGEYMDSLDECRMHAREYRQPCVVRVIDVSSGECVRTMRWHEGGWCDERDSDWDD